MSVEFVKASNTNTHIESVKVTRICTIRRSSSLPRWRSRYSSMPRKRSALSMPLLQPVEILRSPRVARHPWQNTLMYSNSQVPFQRLSPRALITLVRLDKLLFGVVIEFTLFHSALPPFAFLVAFRLGSIVSRNSLDPFGVTGTTCT